MFKLHKTPKEHIKCSLFDIKINDTFCMAEFARVSAMPFNTWWPGHQRPLDQTEESAFISFESDEAAVLEVKTDKIIERAVVRPLSKNVEVTVVDENTVSFKLSDPGNYVLEINGLHNPLNIFFNPIRNFKAEAEAAKKNGREVLYFGEGIHEIGIVDLPSHSTVIVDAGAVVYGGFSAFDAEDIVINGYGIIDGSKEIRNTENLIIPVLRDKETILYFENNKEKFNKFITDTKCLNGLLRFYFCKNITCEGVILRDSSSFCVVPAACDNVIFNNLKLIGMWRYNSDGIDVFNSSNIVIKNCFVRTFDDSIVIKGIAGWELRNNENIVVENCVVWCDWGAALEIGAETNADEFRNILYKNCDIIYDASASLIRIHHHNFADIHNVSYDNIHCEFRADQMSTAMQENDEHKYFNFPNTFQPYIFDLRVNKDNNYGRDNRQGSMHDISFNNIYLHYEEGMVINPQIHFIGVNDECYVKNVFLKNFYINGVKVDNISKLEPDIEEYVYNIRFE